MKIIDSPKNDTIKNIIKLKQTKYQKKERLYLLEGRHEIMEAIKAQAPLQQLLVTQATLDANPAFLGDFETILISETVSKHLADTKTDQGVFAVLPILTPALPTTIKGAWLWLDDLQDPGNVGTLVRTADAAGFAGVIFGSNTVSAYHPKTLRGMQGSQFHIPLYKADLMATLLTFKAQGLPIYGTALGDNTVSFRDVGPVTDFALVIGNEGNGMAPDLLQATTQNLYIPIAGAAESLNAAVAAGILMFQLRQ
ncbi:MAG: RNA methyltransferase [Lactobacillus sp.]|nr:RNA methyltransferase [Lactobacillus sp.]